LRRRVKAAIYAGLVLAGMVVAPVLVWSSLPSELVQMVGMVGFDVQGLLLNVAGVGVIMAVLTFLKTDNEEGNALNLYASLGVEGLGFYLTLLGLGLGDPLSLGRSSLRLPAEGAEVGLTLDFRFLVLGYGTITALRIVTVTLRYIQTRETTKPDSYPKVA
jgi:hypothetical protein